MLNIGLHENPYIYITFSHLADTFIQSDIQMRTTEAINCSIKTTKNRSKTKSENFINTAYTHFKNKELGLNKNDKCIQQKFKT